MIKLPKKQTPKESAHPEIHAVAVGWNECIDEVKRLNATAQPVIVTLPDAYAFTSQAMEDDKDGEYLSKQEVIEVLSSFGIKVES